LGRPARQPDRRFGKSGVDPRKHLATFNFDFNPSVHKPTNLEIASCRFLEHRHCVFFVGPSGVGKFHLAQAVGHEALMRGVDVL
jgi:DNA replication protein DnaC